MSLIKKDTDYAIRALTLIASNSGKIYNSKKISEDLDIPYSYLRKLLQVFNKNNILISIKGKGGGFKINKNPEKIFLRDIIYIFQGDIKIKNCYIKSEKCPETNICLLNKKLTMIEELIKKEIHLINIQSLIESKRDLKLKK